MKRLTFLWWAITAMDAEECINYLDAASSARWYMESFYQAEKTRRAK